MKRLINILVLFLLGTTAAGAYAELAFLIKIH